MFKGSKSPGIQGPSELPSLILDPILQGPGVYGEVSGR